MITTTTEIGVFYDNSALPFGIGSEFESRGLESDVDIADDELAVVSNHLDAVDAVMAEFGEKREITPVPVLESTLYSPRLERRYR